MRAKSPAGAASWVRSRDSRAIIRGRQGRNQGGPVSLKAFVVEDNRAIRESLVETLAELAGITTTGVASSECLAIEWLNDHANEWDIAIVDLTLERGGSGLKVLSALRNREPGKLMVVLTGTTNPDVRLQCEMLGSDRVFDKSIETDALIEYCQALSGTRVPPEVARSARTS
jgi:two-component system OmpR family response regulator